MKIGELAEAVGVTTKTIRFYESFGLLPEPPASGYRSYADADAERMRFIKTAQRLGLSLDEIREIIAFRDRGERPCGYVTAVLDRQVRGLDRRLEEMRQLRDELRHLAPVAGALVAFAGAGPAFLVNAASFVISAALLRGLPTSPAAASGSGRRLGDVAEGLRVIRGSRFLSTLAGVQL